MIEAQLSRCPYCGRTDGLDGADYDAYTSTAVWSDSDFHGFDTRQAMPTQARPETRRCRHCGGIWTTEQQ